MALLFCNFRINTFPSYLRCPNCFRYSVTVTKNTEMCHVHYASLNFRDVMLATGKLSIDAVPGRFVDFDKLVGSEFSGVDSSGRRVMGMVPVNVSTHFLHRRNISVQSMYLYCKKTKQKQVVR